MIKVAVDGEFLGHFFSEGNEISPIGESLKVKKGIPSGFKLVSATVDGSVLYLYFAKDSVIEERNIVISRDRTLQDE